MADEKELSVNEAAERAKTHPRNIRESLRQGRAPRAYKEGRTWKIPEGDMHFLEDRKPGRPWHRIVLHKKIEPQPEEDLTIKEFAAELGVNIPRAKVIARRCPNAYKKGTDWRIPRGDLDLVKERHPGRPWHKSDPVK